MAGGKHRLRRSTRASYAEHVKLYFKPGLGHIRLVDLRDQHFEELYAAMRQFGRPNPPRSEMLRRLRAARRREPRPITPARLRRAHPPLPPPLTPPTTPHSHP